MTQDEYFVAVQEARGLLQLAMGALPPGQQEQGITWVRDLDVISDSMEYHLDALGFNSWEEYGARTKAWSSIGKHERKPQEGSSWPGKHSKVLGGLGDLEREGEGTGIPPRPTEDRGSLAMQARAWKEDVDEDLYTYHGDSEDRPEAERTRE